MGEFFAESLIFAETANSVGAIQVASSTQITQTPFFIAAERESSRVRQALVKEKARGRTP